MIEYLGSYFGKWPAFNVQCRTLPAIHQLQIKNWCFLFVNLWKLSAINIYISIYSIGATFSPFFLTLICLQPMHWNINELVNGQRGYGRH